MSRRLTHTSNSGTTESSSSHQLTADEHPSDDDVGGSFQGDDPLATESGDMVPLDGSGSTSSNTSKRKNSGRVPGKVPEPTAPTDRPLITPTGDCQWEFVPTKPPKARLPNHVIGSLVRKYFPGLAKPNDDDSPSPGFTWEHYQHTKDEQDVTMAARVIDGFHEAFSCVYGEKDKATKALVKSTRKILSDVKHTLRYKAVMQCRPLDDKGEKMTRKTACQTNLEKEEYLSVPRENWMKEDCWEALVDMWCDLVWQAQHVEKGVERAKMPGPSHVQGRRNLTTLKQHMESTLGRSVHILEAWKEGHKGKDGAEFCSQSAQERYETFREVFYEVHRQDTEPTSKPLDPELLIIAGEGKGHGRHLLCNGAIATSSHRKLHEIRASSTSSTPSIRSRPTAASREITRLKTKFELLEVRPVNYVPTECRRYMHINFVATASEQGSRYCSSSPSCISVAKGGLQAVTA